VIIVALAPHALTPQPPPRGHPAPVEPGEGGFAAAVHSIAGVFIRIPHDTSP
jgi:hypothetical protein